MTNNMQSVHAIYFSPANSTRTLVRAVASGMSNHVREHDVTQGSLPELHLSDKDMVVLGVPSYSGRVPALAMHHLASLEGHGAAVVILCSYGNRAYDDTLLELEELCRSRGFRVVSAAAFVARHSIFPSVAAGRPDTLDLEEARLFGVCSAESAQRGQEAHLDIKGNVAYREAKRVPLAPTASAVCNACLLCVAKCPVGAISSDNPRKTDKSQCIACARCIEYCPQQARSFSGIIYTIARWQFSKRYNVRKENEFIGS